LAQHPELANLAGRFDVALVRNSPNLGLILQSYLEAAFTIDT
jgi:Holliday junction resolvase-like predicted endonuclease